MTRHRGVIAAGHAITAQAGQQILMDGGNAFSAVVAAAFAACAAEPLLASLGGGGYLTARLADGEVRVYDFFGQTPRQHRADAECFPIEGDFGTAKQEFHIGMGTTATPGMVDGLFTIIDQLADQPTVALVAPAKLAATAGVEVNPFQASIAEILEPIIRSQSDLSRHYRSEEKLMRAGDKQYFPNLDKVLQALADQGPALFCDGEIGQNLLSLSAEHGGHLSNDDLQAYRTIVRRPLQTEFAGTSIFTNPIPSCGGSLIAHSLAAFTQTESSQTIAQRILLALRATQLGREQSRIQHDPQAAQLEQLLDWNTIDTLLRQLQQSPMMSRGTTQISVADEHGNLAAMTLSNGEGNGYLIPGTDIQLNNYLGEHDLNPAGIGRWTPDRRLSSMMAPTLINHDQTWTALGSGGSNRIRSAIAQTLIHRFSAGRNLSEAIEIERMHLEGAQLSVEGDHSIDAPDLTIDSWPEKNVFFGGVHAVEYNPQRGFDGHGDSRRGGCALFA